MAQKAGFAEIDITPPVGVEKIGWLKVIVSDHVLDRLYARAAVLECDGRRVGFIQMDTLFAPADLVAEVRRRVEADTGFPGGSVMVAATHNHAGPAVDNVGVVRCDAPYVEALTGKLAAVFATAVERLAPAEVGFDRAFEFDVPHNRRLILRDGTARTHGTFEDPQALCFEGPIDPEVAVLAVRDAGGTGLLGALVNFACHPAHHGPDGALSAGYPGVLAAEMKSRGCPVTMFLQGAAGNIHSADPARGGVDMQMAPIGKALARDVVAALANMQFSRKVRLGWAARTVQLPFRALSPEQIRGTARGAQRFVDPALYDRTIPAEVERIRRMGTQPAEVQVLFVNDVAFVAVGAEYFVEFGLRIKQRAWPVRALVVSCAKGRLGYVPTREAFGRGGYETTFGPSSCLGPDAGDLLADTAVELIRGGPG
jgi:hypothetical protein